MTQQKNSHGFSVLLTVLAIFVVTAMGVGGWMLWQKNKSPAVSNSASTDKRPQTESKQPLPATDPSEGGKYLVVKEWDVRFKLPPQLQGDAYYEYSNDTLESVRLRSKKLDQITSHCGNAVFYLYGGISRGKAKLTEQTYPYAAGEIAFTQINSHWYDIFDTGNEAAATYTCENNVKVSEQKDAFKASIGGAQAVTDSFRTLESMSRR